MLLGPGDVGWLRALVVSAVVGPVVCVASYLNGQTWAAMLFALFSLSAVRQFSEARAKRADGLAGIDDKLQKATESIDDGDYGRAQNLAEQVVRSASQVSLRYAGMHVLAIALLEQGRAEEALAALQPIPPSHADDVLIGACLLHAGRAAEAVLHLETAVRQGAGGKSWELLAEALEHSGQPGKAEEVRAQARKQQNLNG
jgi:thioredoxin-like negative regulator of GroEL